MSMKNISEFMDEVTKPGYGDMYNKYLIQVYTNELSDLIKRGSLKRKL